MYVVPSRELFLSWRACKHSLEIALPSHPRSRATEARYIQLEVFLDQERRFNQRMVYLASGGFSD
jgi:hypothetical protein